ncbi:MAG: glycoside hydrolase family 97 catalytic domain-containing protein [Prevotella sp.]|nr:glycoside hydrolase family 97 catalytic domain-containing protein [Prevotella sp.]
MMNFRRFILFAVLSLAAFATAQAAEQLSSPNGKYLFRFTQDHRGLHYAITWEGREVTRGDLGVDIDNHLVESAMGVPNDTCQLWTSDLQLTGVDRQVVDTTWRPVYGENAVVRDHYQQMTLHLQKGALDRRLTDGYQKGKEYLLDIIVRAYDEGVAFQYHFPEATNGLFIHVSRELTTYKFSPGTEAYQESWAQGPYHRLPLSGWKDESERPLLLSLPGGLQVALLEAGLHDYVRGKLRLTDDNELQVSMHSPADMITPFSTPWRVVMAAERAVDLINHKDLVLNLNAPCRIQDTSFIRPGKAFRVAQLNMASALQCVDFAQERGLQYIELDAGWYGPEMKINSSALKVAASRDIDMPQLCRYARSKGIGVWLYVNQRALSQQLDSILPLYRQWGVSGLKFGFVQVGSQMWTTWLHDAVRKCADYHLMVDIHDEYRPTGWSRTYPNLMTQEGIRGNEEMPDATHNTILPFTRFLCGPADYTLCYFNGRVKNTKAHQLAMSVVYYSPITFMYWYDQPSAYKGERELDFWKTCPTVWDESRALDGQPGEYIVQARRTGNDWHVGVMNGMESRTLALSTSDFLQKGRRYIVELYQDDPTLTTRTKVSTTVLKVKSGRTITLKLQPSGGAALRFIQQ